MSAPSRVVIDLRFEKPFKQQSVTTFTSAPDIAGSEVTWHMTGQLDLFMKVFTKIKPMDTLIGPDFEKGLATLKDVSEGQSPSA